VGFRITHPSGTIFYSGDAGYTEDLASQAEGADLAIVESTWGKDFEHFASTRSEEEVGLMKRTHMTEEEARRVGERAREYVLVHQIKINHHLRQRRARGS